MALAELPEPAIVRPSPYPSRVLANEFAASLAPLIMDLQTQGLSLNAMACVLSGRGIVTPRGGGWTAQAVSNVVRRLTGAQNTG
jgi:Recombinase